MLQGSLGRHRDDVGEASGGASGRLRECLEEDSGSLPEASGRLRGGLQGGFFKELVH